MIRIVFLSTLVFVFTACGVKGDPQPPLEPPQLGRGKPTFKKAAESVKIKKRKKEGPADDFDEPNDFEESDDK